jgi:NitT/TauT family transport system substrate-binding protein
MEDRVVRVIVSRHSAFYSPLIATLAAGFLEAEGYQYTYDVLRPGQRSQWLIREGAAHVMQSAVSSNWGPLERGETDLPVHFAQINRRDGFFLAAREPDPQFDWKKLEGRRLLADHALQPLAMLKYAAHCQAVNWEAVQVLDAGAPEEMEAAFRSGEGDYVHLQGPAPQQAEHDGAGFVVAAVGDAMPPVAFSSLLASREFLGTDAAAAFLRAYRGGREWAQSTPPAEIARREAAFFPGVPEEALSAAIGSYQRLGCWGGGLEIPRDLYEQALAVFLFSGAVGRRHAYEDVVAAPAIA